MTSDDEIFGYMNPWEDEQEDFGWMEDCPDHLEHTALMESDDD